MRTRAILICLLALCWLCVGVAGGDAAYEAPDMAQANEVAVHEAAAHEAVARAAVLIDAQTGRILYAKNENEALPMASTTKIMTALLALEHCAPDEAVVAGKNASGVEGTSIYLSVGETLTMRQMLLGLMLRSGNDAAVAIAEHVAGSTAAFAALMNARAQALDAEAQFVTPNGLDAPGHAASALGMARIARAAMANSAFRELAATTRAVIPWVGNEYQRVLTNKNRLLTDYEGATGIKTGFTSKSGRCLVFSARRDDFELIGALLNCPNWFGEAEALLDWGFATYAQAEVARAGEVLGSVPIAGGDARAVDVYAAEALRIPVRAGEQWRLQIELPSRLQAPVAVGQVVGRAVILLAGEEIAHCELLADRRVSEWNFRRALSKTFERWLFFFRGA